MIMKALSVKQPWASMIASGVKTIETRTWYTEYRGPLLICSSKQPTGQGPTGKALCVVDLVDCRRMRSGDQAAAGCVVYEGAYSWVLANVRLVEPFPVKGMLGLFDVEVQDGS